jgi:predicted RNA-binding protein YlqC (UPF0109 family)
MKDFIEYLITGIVNKPKEVKVEESRDGDLFVFNINVDPQDMGIVIGKAGKNIRAIRNMAKAKAIKDNIHIKVVLEESDEEFFAGMQDGNSLGEKEGNIEMDENLENKPETSENDEI